MAPYTQDTCGMGHLWWGVVGMVQAPRHPGLCQSRKYTGTKGRQAVTRGHDAFTLNPKPNPKSMTQSMKAKPEAGGVRRCALAVSLPVLIASRGRLQPGGFCNRGVAGPQRDHVGLA